ncbi:low-specificity L-threonine aldolase [Nocardiopsis rhodophaea]|uniref:Low-specificity L-threonine aldolase n=1 Tax=Nocardiopsis rhodophaea TaxID=280238 RepID=A0ABP5EM23_9ACTN
MIDLRSDTVTKPTPDMRRAMAEAEVGDDVFGEDPTIRALEEETARLLGKEQALYVPSGHMANQIAVYVSARSGEEIWAHATSHVLGNEQGASSVLARVVPRTFDAPDAVPDSALLERWSAGIDDVHRARPALLCLENTFTGRVVPLSEQRRVTAFAHSHGMRAHLDGARLWNAAVALGAAPAEVADGFDTVSTCFSKGLGAPVGSAVAGDADTIQRARRARKLLGGGMRQAGIIAAGALYALRNNIDRLADDHSRAARLAKGITSATGLAAESRTNMVLVTTEPGEAPGFAADFAEQGVRCVAIGPDLVRLVVHLEIGDADIDTAIAAIGAAVTARGGAPELSRLRAGW